ncbi:MAG: hypothetical protein HY528_00515 [Chloroflexi bacterium]|nr:hypothetical protein [Chloroflexota bacterium]
MIKRILLLAAIFILILAAPVRGAETNSGIIEGRIVNATATGGSVNDQLITLRTYLSDTEKTSATTKTDTEGRFTFTGLVTTNTSYSYDVTATFQEADYTSERLTFKAEELSKSIEITVYDSTGSDATIRVADAHTIIFVGQGSLKIVEVFSVSNDSDRTYIGSGEITATGKRRTVMLPLPDKSTDLQYGGELMLCCVLPPDKEGFWDTMPVLPGSKTIAYSSQVSYSGGEYTYSRKVYAPTASYDLLIQGKNIAVAGDQLVSQGLVEFENSQFQQFSGGDFTLGDVVLAKLSVLPQSANQGPILWIVLTLIVLAGGFGLIYLKNKGRLQPVRVGGSLEQRRQGLLAELAQMDDYFEGGKIAEKDYRRLRAEKKAQIVTLQQRPKEGRGKR